MRCLPLLLLLLAITSSTVHSQTSWENDIQRAALEGNVERVRELVEADRLGVSDIVSGLIGSGLSTDDPSTLDAAELVAEVHADLFDEDAHLRRVSFARTLDAKNRRVKIRADSLYQEAFARRGAAETRDEARSLYLQALELYESIGDLGGKAETEGQLGYVSWSADKEAYLAHNEKALQLRRELGDLKLIGNSLNDVGIYHYAVTRDYESALEHFTESERIRWAIGDSTVLNRMLGLIAGSHEQLGNFDQATDYYEKASDLYLALGDTAQYIRQRNNAAQLLTDYWERHADALSAMLELREELESFNDPRSVALVSNSLGIASRRLGDYESAIAYYQEALSLSEEHGFEDVLSHAINNIGVLNVWIGRSGRAIPYFERALELFRDAGDAASQLNELINLGSAHFEERAFDRSLEYYAAAETVALTINDEIKLGTVHQGFANTLVRSGNPDESASRYQQAIQIARDYELPELLMGAQFGLGDVAEVRGNPQEALSHYRKGMQTMEKARGLLTASEDKARSLAQSRYVFEDVIDFLTKQATQTGEASWVSEAFNFAERAKARAFVDLLAEAIADVKQGVDPTLLSDQEVLTDNLLYLRNELETTEDRETRDELKTLIRDQEIEYDRVERDLRTQNPAYADLRYPEPATLAALQASLLAGDLVLSYAVGDSSSTLWSITRSKADIHVLPVRSEIAAAVDLLRFALVDPVRTNADAYADAAGRLFDMIAEPALDDIRAADTIVIMPDDVLHYVPFEALVVESGSSWTGHQYLVHTADIGYAPSASVLLQLDQRPDRTVSRELLAVGNPEFGGTNELSALRGSMLQPLPYAEEEVDAIASLFNPSQADVFKGADASEANILEIVSRQHYRFLHFATHGLIDEDRPDYSALALARGASRGEGLLQAREIFNHPFSADLAVLSACETGLGQFIQGEGMVGLTRAFMYAGTPSIVASLWSVADASTSSLMQELYTGMVQDNQSPQTSLRNAKMALLEDPETAHPFYWAPFVYFGTTR